MGTTWYAWPSSGGISNATIKLVTRMICTSLLCALCDMSLQTNKLCIVYERTRFDKVELCCNRCR